MRQLRQNQTLPLLVSTRLQRHHPQEHEPGISAASLSRHHTHIGEHVVIIVRRPLFPKLSPRTVRRISLVAALLCLRPLGTRRARLRPLLRLVHRHLELAEHARKCCQSPSTADRRAAARSWRYLNGVVVNASFATGEEADMVRHDVRNLEGKCE